MDLATGAMGSLLLKLGNLLMEEYKLQTGVKEDVEYMKRELTSMYIALRKVGDVPRDQLDLQVKSWADEVRDLSYMMEDIIDKFLVRVEGANPAVKPRKLKRLMKKMGDLFTKSKTRYEISDEIRTIKIRVQEAADRRDRYKVSDVVVNPAGVTIADPRLLALYKDKEDLVGIHGPMKELTNMLSDEHGDVEKQLKIVSIFGFGGLGKTTLAKALYDKIQSPFDCSAFVPVGRNPSAKKVLNDILFEINKNTHPEMDERQLIDKLRVLLKNKRYFIVIDDIWETKIWEIIRCALEHNNCGSKIMTTTRILDVATKTGEVYLLKSLSHDLSKELFHRKLSGGNSKNIYDLPAEVYDKILHKCGGVPLAIITIASLLDNKPVEFWSKIYNSIGFGHEDNNDVDNTRKILLFSYYDLPCHLRTCLLHLSIYPEDRLIKKDSLIWLWVGEGFITEEPGVGLFEIGERYFNELLNKSMLLPVENLDDGVITGCRVHDIVLDMICLLAKEENFVTILDSNEQYTSSHSNARRLAIGWRKDPLASAPMLQVRSFNVMEYTTCKLPSLSCFEVLRVLNLKDDNTTDELEHIGKLFQLRYLGLGPNSVVLEEIGYLKFLQVLDLGSNYSSKELPRSICQLSQLKCLKADNAWITVEQDWIGNLTSLEELRVYSVDASSNFATELVKLTELRKLRIIVLYLTSVSLVKAWAKSLVKLQKLQAIDVQYVFSYDTGDVTLEGYVPPQQLRVFNLAYKQPGLYFIVIDDIWDTKTWEIIRCALVHNNYGSRIITTTRIHDVATKTGDVYRLKPLSHDLSKELFHRRLSGGNGKGPSDLSAEVYDKILHKCGGVPLGIITIASLLDSKPVEFWSKIYNSVGFGHEDNNDVDNTRSILLFSYYDLPCHLRTCLLHMSIYPEDRLIEKDSLIWLWVGEGFIHEEPGVGLFEIGERYFNELLNKSMLLPVETPYEGIISGCRIHDIVLDMICLLAKEENFVTILDSNEQYRSSHSNAHRLAIAGLKDPLASAPMSQVRSFNVMEYTHKLPSLSCFEVLRVLNLKEDTTTDELEHIGKLFQLRYLRLSSKRKVPKEIGYLKFLQVLELGRSFLNKELPQSIGQLSQLKCLKADHAEITVAQDWIGKLTSLEELCVYSVEASSNFATELAKLTELRNLRITVLDLSSASLVNAWAESLVKLQKLQAIDVQYVLSYDTGDVTLEGYVPPQQLRVFNLSYKQPGLYASIISSCLPNLTHLSLHVDSPDVQIFGRFPGLVYLSLDMDRPDQGHFVMGSAGVGLFPKLRVYKTRATPGRFLPGAMPSLEFLKFSVDVWTSRDGNINFDFDSLVNLPMLQKVDITMWSGQNIKDEDWRKAEETVRHALDNHPNNPTLNLNVSGRGALSLLDDPDAYGV